jgi:two-component system sensor histidine kinase RegB
MSNHFIGMWANFLLSVIVVTFVVGAMAKVITSRERALAKQREEQLRSEQLLALGVASAQVTHQLATPLSNLQLLFDELIENYPNDPAVTAMNFPLKQCSEQLGYFRSLATSIRENKKELLYIEEMLSGLIDSTKLNFPLLELDIVKDDNCEIETIQIETDAMFLPALLNLIQNGVKANEKNNQNKLILKLYLNDNSLHLELRDFGPGLKTQSGLLGEKLVKSDSGLGMAILLSNSTFERLGGNLKLYNHPEQGAIAHVTISVRKT